MNGKRTPAFGKEDYQRNHLCISNPEVQELMLKEMEKQFDLGYDWVQLSQTDGYRECECPKCKALMMPKKVNGNMVYACSCGYIDKKEKAETSFKEKVKEEKDVEVIEGNFETRPVTDAECPKCGNDKAWYYLVQTRASDEPETKFLQCTKCKHKWRDYK